MGKLKVLLKIAFSLFFMWIILRNVDFAALAKVLSSANLGFIVLSFIIFSLAMLILVQRWNFLLRVFRKDIPFRNLVSVYWIGLFFSLFLPSSIGGDVVKMYKLSKNHGKTIEISASVLMDRIVGLTSLTILSSVSFFFFRGSFNFDVVGKIVMFMTVSLSLFYLVIFNANLIKRLKFIRKILSLVKAEKIIRDLYLSFNLYLKHIDSLVASILTSLFCNLMVAFSIYLLADAVGMTVPLVYFFVIMPIVFMLMFIPISMSGLGLQDGAYVFFLGQLGVPATLAFSMSLLAHLVRYLSGLIGGVIYMLERDRSQG